MNRRNHVTLGVNQQFLYVQAMTDARAHTDTLKALALDERIDALDCWVWASNRSEETRILRDSGKIVNYNIGDRAGAPPISPASADAASLRDAKEVIRREVDMALESGAKKIIVGSGPDFPHDRSDAIGRFEEFIRWMLSLIPEDVQLTLEPTDRDIDKRFLFGPLEETNVLVRRIRTQAHDNFGVLLDMGHIPLLRETIPDAAQKVCDTIMHVHLGNAIVGDPTHPLYGDKHPAWNAPGGEYGEDDVFMMLKSLREIGYIREGAKPTISFEMRIMDGMTPDESLDEFIRTFDRAWMRMA